MEVRFMLLFNKTIWEGVLYGTTEQFTDVNLAALFGQAEKFVFTCARRRSRGHRRR
jgi:hypothetical protein